MRIALRRIARRPGFSLVVIALLAGAVGINATVFAVLNAVAFRRLPYPAADRLVDIRLAERCAYCGRVTIPKPIVDEWQRSVRSIEKWGVSYANTQGFVLPESKRELRGSTVTPSMLELLGAPMQAGRSFTDDDDIRGAAPRVILSAPFFQRHFQGDRTVVGRFMTINTRQFEIIGVADGHFSLYAEDPDVWFTPSGVGVDGSAARAAVIARLAPGATVARLNAELAQAGVPMIAQIYGRDSDLRPSALPLSRVVAFGEGLELALMQLLALVVLAVACANVAGLLLARQQAERHLIGMRVVLGARARDLLALPLLDAVPLVIAGTSIGLLVAAQAAPFAGAYLGASVAHRGGVRVDGVVITVTMLAAALVAFLIALVPARELFRTELRSWIQMGSQATASSRQSRTRQQVLVGAQIGISTTLLLIASVLVLNYARLSSGAAGHEQLGSLSAEFTVSPRGDPDAVMSAVTSRLAGVPGIRSAYFWTVAPLRTALGLMIDGAETPVFAGSSPPAELHYGPRSARMAVLRGRAFTDEEIRGRAEAVVIVNESMANQLWHGNALGRRLRTAPGQPWRVVVGITQNSSGGNARVAADPSRAAPLYSIPGIPHDAGYARLNVFTDGDAEPFLDAVGRAIDEVAPNTVTTLSASADTRDAREESRMRTVLLAVLAAFALLMATVGVGTLVAFSTGLRAREFGIRTALGATSRMIVREVFRDALQMSAKGMLLAAVGTLGAYFAFIPMLYFNAKIFDWRIAFGAMATMTLFIVGASLVPAWRAARTHPAEVLRGD